MKKLQKVQRAECRKAYHQYLILDPDAGKSKRLYLYVKSLKKDSSTVGPLFNSDAATQATLLNNQFASVFTDEDTTDMPDLTHAPFPDMDRHPWEWSRQNVKEHQGHRPGRDTSAPVEGSCWPASPDTNPDLPGVLQPRYRPCSLATSRCRPGIQKGRPSYTLKLPADITDCHLLQTDGAHHADQHNAPPRQQRHPPRLPAWLSQASLVWDSAAADIHRALDTTSKPMAYCSISRRRLTKSRINA